MITTKKVKSNSNLNIYFSIAIKILNYFVSIPEKKNRQEIITSEKLSLYTVYTLSVLFFLQFYLCFKFTNISHHLKVLTKNKIK